MTLLEELEQIEQRAREELGDAGSPEALEQWRIRYLGGKGAVKEAMRRLRDVPADRKRAAGKAANRLKNALRSGYEQRLAELAAGRRAEPPREDVTLPGAKPRIGHAHVLTQTIDAICEIFARMGFEVAYGPEVDDEWHNFDALNTPPSHPARDPWENFYIDAKTVLRPQTSTVQIRVMEQQDPPVRVISCGRAYRPDTVDATHCFMFHQVEGLYVDDGVSMVDLKTCLDQFCKAYFGPEVRTRFRPHFFPFTEPSAEVDIEFHYPSGRREWIELGGCGMVDPNVLEAVGYDAERYTGYAFGLGIERMAMRKQGIPDIRLLFENDVRFLRQF